MKVISILKYIFHIVAVGGFLFALFFFVAAIDELNSEQNIGYAFAFVFNLIGTLFAAGGGVISLIFSIIQTKFKRTKMSFLLIWINLGVIILSVLSTVLIYVLQ